MIQGWTAIVGDTRPDQHKLQRQQWIKISECEYKLRCSLRVGLFARHTRVRPHPWSFRLWPVSRLTSLTTGSLNQRSELLSENNEDLHSGEHVVKPHTSAFRRLLPAWPVMAHQSISCGTFRRMARSLGGYGAWDLKDILALLSTCHVHIPHSVALHSTAIQGNTYPILSASIHLIPSAQFFPHPILHTRLCINLPPQKRLDLLPPHNLSFINRNFRHTPSAQPVNRIRQRLPAPLVPHLPNRIRIRLKRKHQRPSLWQSVQRLPLTTQDCCFEIDFFFFLIQGGVLAEVGYGHVVARETEEVGVRGYGPVTALDEFGEGQGGEEAVH
jgi:hypothetical protein